MRKKILGFLKENGFLVFLFICVCIVSISTILMLTKDTDTGNKGENTGIINKNEEDPGDENLKEVSQKQNEEEKEIKDLEENLEEDLEKEVQEEVVNKSEDKSKEENEDNNQDKEKNNSEDKGKKNEKENTSENPRPQASLTMPLDGEIITNFAVDSLIYSKTLDEWRGHEGIDIKAKPSSKVKSAGAGTIKEAYEDPLWGFVILIDHGGGLLSKYANLESIDMVRIGQRVEGGQVIGAIGRSASIESLMEDHLHYEVIKDGKNVDPRSIK